MGPIKIPYSVIEVPEAGFTASKLMIIPSQSFHLWMKTILGFTRAP